MMTANPLKLLLAIALLLLSRMSNSAAQEMRLKVFQTDANISIRVERPGRTSFELVHAVLARGERPYLHPVRDASGRFILTEDKPADHPWQHGIFTGFHRVNGFNYWKEDEGKQRLVRVLTATNNEARAGWTSLSEWIDPKGDVVAEEEQTITVHAPHSTEAYWIDFGFRIRPVRGPLHFGKFFVGGLSVRMPWDKTDPQQTHLNSQGQRGRACEQQRARWCTVERPFGDEIFGAAIFDRPDNANYPSGWRVDEQGLINPNISMLGDWSIPAAESRTFRYSILIYRGHADADRLEKALHER